MGMSESVAEHSAFKSGGQNHMFRIKVRYVFCLLINSKCMRNMMPGLTSYYKSIYKWHRITFVIALVLMHSEKRPPIAIRLRPSQKSISFRPVQKNIDWVAFSVFRRPELVFTPSIVDFFDVFLFAEVRLCICSMCFTHFANNYNIELQSNQWANALAVCRFYCLPCVIYSLHWRRAQKKWNDSPRFLFAFGANGLLLYLESEWLWQIEEETAAYLCNRGIVEVLWVVYVLSGLFKRWRKKITDMRWITIQPYGCKELRKPLPKNWLIFISIERFISKVTPNDNAISLKITTHYKITQTIVRIGMKVPNTLNLV